MAKIITIRVTDEMKEKLLKTAKNMGLTLNSLILSVLWEYVKGGKRDGRDEN